MMVIHTTLLDESMTYEVKQWVQVRENVYFILCLFLFLHHQLWEFNKLVLCGLMEIHFLSIQNKNNIFLSMFKTYLSWMTEINELFHDILIYWDAPVYINIENYIQEYISANKTQNVNFLYYYHYFIPILVQLLYLYKKE